MELQGGKNTRKAERGKQTEEQVVLPLQTVSKSFRKQHSCEIFVPSSTGYSHFFRVSTLFPFPSLPLPAFFPFEFRLSFSSFYSSYHFITRI